VKDVIKSLDRIGSIGALLAAAAAPCCFPLLAAVAAASGLTLLGRFETTVLYVFQGFALVAILGLPLNYRKHRCFGPLALDMLSGAALRMRFIIRGKSRCFTPASSELLSPARGTGFAVARTGNIPCFSR